MSGKIKQTAEKAVELLTKNPSGMRHSELVEQLKECLPGIPENSIRTTVSQLEVRSAQRVTKVGRGVYQLTRNVDTDSESVNEAIPIVVGNRSITEDEFYEPFAAYLVDELDECTNAIAVGGKAFKDKWGTPDVVGIRELSRTAVLKFPAEIIAAEIKIDSSSTIVAFGQACAYRIFAHKSYIVIPRTSLAEEISKIDALSRILGIGLVLFDETNPESPRFEIRSRATKGDPDIFYVDRYMKLIEKELFS